MHSSRLYRRQLLLRALSVGTLVSAASLPGSDWLLGRAQASPSETSVRDGVLHIAVGGQGLLYYLPLVVAQQLGYFDAEGLRVMLHDYEGGVQALQAVSSGAAQICSGAYEHVLMEQAQARYFKAFVLLGRSPQMALGVSPRWMPQCRNMSKLAGSCIGVASMGSAVMHATQLALLHHGLSIDSVRFIDVGMGPAAASALQSGRVHAVAQPDPLISVLEERGDVQVICDLRNPTECEQIYGGSMPSAALYATEAFVQKYPAQAQGVANAMLRALLWLQTASMLDLVKLVPAHYWMGSRRAYLAAFEKMRLSISPDGLMPAEGPAIAQRSLQRLYPALALPAGRRLLEPGRSYTNLFAQRARQKLRV